MASMQQYSRWSRWHVSVPQGIIFAGIGRIIMLGPIGAPRSVGCMGMPASGVLGGVIVGMSIGLEAPASDGCIGI
jgi:hypothetical protein